MAGRTEILIKELSAAFTQMQPDAEQQRGFYNIMEELRKLFDDMEEGENDGMSRKRQMWERKLLDLTLHNNLLNMKIGKKAAMFCPCPIDQLEDLLADGEEYPVASELIDEKTLKGLFRTARTMTEESGISALFFTLGTLHYAGIQAPILLMPIDIVNTGKNQYAIRKREEDTCLNATLAEYLRQIYDINLKLGSASVGSTEGELPRDAHGLDVSLIMHQVRNSIQEHADWSVSEDSAIGIFSFAKYVMWHDIHTHGYVLDEHPLLKSLVEGRLMIDENVPAADASQLDATMRPDSLALPMPFDSSQMEAVVDAQEGRSFVLYGPPGTGKSQTITNMIANSMYHGKRVLFVAQKKAALEVVEHRLSALGLAPFCLELHSNKIDKKQFLKQMQQLLDVAADTPAPTEEYSSKANQIFAKRMEMNSVIEAVNIMHSSGYTLHECMSGYMQIAGQPLNLPEAILRKLTRQGAEELLNECRNLDTIQSLSENPLHDLTPDLNVRDIEKALEQDLHYLRQSIANAQKQTDSDLNRKFMKKTARQLLESDYRWKHFSQIANPSSLLLDNFANLLKAVDRWETNLNMLPQWMSTIKPLSDLRKKGLDEVVDRYLQGEKGHDLACLLQKGVYKSLADIIIHDTPALASFNGLQFELVIEQYRQMSAEFMQATRKELLCRLAAAVPLKSHDATLSGELTLLRKRIANNGRGTSIRGIIDQIPHLLPALCPCMLMSPLSVAQYLDLDAPKFDIVIFDEASQMPTGEAVGSIARGKSVIVVGDPKQMPPTSFFAATSDEDDVTVDDLESILHDCISLSMPAHYLSWHYRSLHESLISFSNQHYYDGKLLTFPSADDQVSHVSYVHVDGIYDFGKTRTNTIEAQAVVNEVMSRLKKADIDSENVSIGVVAFSKQQSDLIEDLLNNELAQQPKLEQLSRSGEEPLFVKNLENVQGDERDVIIFSMGYGPDKEGHISLNFGPLNQAGGERRLNVALSRARKEMKLFSSLRPEQIDERRTNAEGALGLKQFMKFAETGLSSSEQQYSDDTDLMTKAISQRISALGYHVQTNVGRSSFRINIAIAHPKEPNKYVLGIICDGGSYRRLKTAHDREISQPAVLSHLGWQLMHVWQIDWFMHPDWVIQQIVNKIKRVM